MSWLVMAGSLAGLTRPFVSHALEASNHAASQKLYESLASAVAASSENGAELPFTINWRGLNHVHVIIDGYTVAIEVGASTAVYRLPVRCERAVLVPGVPYVLSPAADGIRINQK